MKEEIEKTDFSQTLPLVLLEPTISQGLRPLGPACPPPARRRSSSLPCRSMFNISISFNDRASLREGAYLLGAVGLKNDGRALPRSSRSSLSGRAEVEPGFVNPALDDDDGLAAYDGELGRLAREADRAPDVGRPAGEVDRDDRARRRENTVVVGRRKSERVHGEG